MARAGFFYKPSATNPDNVMCFVCEGQLDGWEPSDNPAFEHFTHSGNCGWAINVCISKRNGDPNRVDEDPMLERMVNSRKATFLDSWPHEHKKGWKCKTQKVWNRTEGCEGGVGNANTNTAGRSWMVL